MDATTTTTTRPTRLFRRYANRKFYDPVESRYVKLEDIANVIRTGADVRVLDVGSQRDVTSVTLARLLSSEEKRRSSESTQPLWDLIRRRAARAAEEVGQEPDAHAASDAEALRVAREAMAGPERMQRLLHDLLNGGHRKAWRARELLGASLEGLDHVDRVTRERTQGACDVVATLARLDAQLSRISRRIGDAYERLRELEAQ